MIELLIPGDYIYPQYFTKFNDLALSSITGATLNSGVLSLKLFNGSSIDINGFNSSSTVFQNNITVSLSGGKTLGRFTNGQVIPSANLTAEQVMNLIAIEFLVPAFSGFYINDQNQTLESGDSIPSGSKTYLWSTTNSSNVSGNSITIKNQTDNTTLGSNLSNDGTEVINLISPIVLNGVTSQTFRILATDTQNTSFQKDFTISSFYKYFYGSNSSSVTNSTQVRALPNNSFYTGGANFNLNTGKNLLKFIIAIPATSTLIQVLDLDAANANLTSSYIQQININVLDAGSNIVIYKVYELNIATAYSSNHRHACIIS